MEFYEVCCFVALFIYALAAINVAHSLYRNDEKTAVRDNELYQSFAGFFTPFFFFLPLFLLSFQRRRVR